MKVLWVVNIPLPEVSSILGTKSTPFGGWLINASNSIVNLGIELEILFPFNKNTGVLNGESINYIGFKTARSNLQPDVNYIESIIRESDYDLINIFGTEYEHSYEVSKICKELKGKRQLITGFIY